MKLKVGMYARTKKGKIGKITDINLAEVQDRYVLDNSNVYMFYKEDISQASHNIIDLIEVGDYVNGCKVIDFMYSKEKKRSVIVDSEIWGFDTEEIKSIVTKEQFSQMEYKVGD